MKFWLMPLRQISLARPYDPYLQTIKDFGLKDTFMTDSEARLFDATGNNIGSYKLEVMDAFWKRFMGLMGRPEMPIGDAALFHKCASIHMFFMKIPLDVIWYGAAQPDGHAPVLAVSRPSSLGNCCSARRTLRDASKWPPAPSP